MSEWLYFSCADCPFGGAATPDADDQRVAAEEILASHINARPDHTPQIDGDVVRLASQGLSEAAVAAASEGVVEVRR